jgi:Integrase core domain
MDPRPHTRTSHRESQDVDALTAEERRHHSERGQASCRSQRRSSARASLETEGAQRQQSQGGHRCRFTVPPSSSRLSACCWFGGCSRSSGASRLRQRLRVCRSGRRIAGWLGGGPGTAYWSIGPRRPSVCGVATRPYRPRTNGKAERFIQTLLREWAYAAAYTTSEQRRLALAPWLDYYNHQRPHGALGHQPPASRLRAA